MKDLRNTHRPTGTSLEGGICFEVSVCKFEKIFNQGKCLLEGCLKDYININKITEAEKLESRQTEKQEQWGKIY